jgi:hypothetical protein
MTDYEPGTDLNTFLPPPKVASKYFPSATPRLDPPAWEPDSAMTRLAITNPIELPYDYEAGSRGPLRQRPKPKPLDPRPKDSIGRARDKNQTGKSFDEETVNRIWEVMARNKLSIKKSREELAALGIEVSERSLCRKIRPIMERVYKENTYPKSLMVSDIILDLSDENTYKDEISWETRQREAKDVKDRILGKPKQQIAHGLVEDMDMSQIMADDGDEESSEESEDKAPEGEWQP